MKQLSAKAQNGLHHSAIALGCMRISALSLAQLDTHVHTALDAGITLFDHADIYGGGACEENFGKLLAAQPSLRQQMILQTKCGIRKGYYDFSKEHILASVDASLQRLCTDQLDILLLHRPDALMEPDEVAEAFATLHASGKVAQFGVSNFNVAQMQLLQSALPTPLVANQMQLSITNCSLISQGIATNTGFEDGISRDGGVLEYCRAHEMVLQCWSPFQYGMFAGSFLDSPEYPELNEVLAQLAAQYSVSKAVIATAWILRHPAGMQVIAGTTNPAHLTDLCTAAHITLTRQEWYALYRAAGHVLP